MHDVGTGTEQMDEEVEVAHAPDGSVGPVVKAVERINLVRLDSEVEQARNSDYIQQSEEDGTNKKQQGKDQGIAVIGPTRKCGMSRYHEVRTLGDRPGQHG